MGSSIGYEFLHGVISSNPFVLGLCIVSTGRGGRGGSGEVVDLHPSRRIRRGLDGWYRLGCRWSGYHTPP